MIRLIPSYADFTKMWFPKRLYSQNFEDLYLQRLFSDIEKGFYVDAGAWHPNIDNVTRIFYEQGWRGINIEPLKEAFDLLEAERKDDYNLNLAVSDLQTVGLVNFSVLGDKPLQNGQHFLTDTHHHIDTKAVDGFGITNIRSVQCSNLREIFEQYALDKQIQFLKLDVEGSEFKALMGLQLEVLSEKMHPNVILLEATLPDTRLSSHCRQDCRNYLEANNYKYLFFDGLNDYYCKHQLYNSYSSNIVPPNIFDRPSINCSKYFEDSVKLSAALSQHLHSEHLISNLSQHLEAKEAELQAIVTNRESDAKQYASSQQQLVETQQQLVETQQQLASTQQQLASTQQQLASTQQQLAESQKQLEQTSKSLTEKQSEASVTSEELKLTLLQLHQMQEELQHYFYQSHGKDELIQKHQAQQKRIKKILAIIFSQS